MIEHFSNETIEGIGYYVYRLIDPRNGQTFYVGKGKGDRVFNHVKGAIDYYEGAENSSDSDPNKFRTINDIKEAGLEVIHVIHRWGLPNEDTAFEVESALIDAYQGLSNIQSGHHTERGVTNAEVIENTFHRPEYREPDSNDFKYIIIKVKDWKIESLVEHFPNPQECRYEATRAAWRIAPKSIEEYPYVLSVTDGVVKAVYKVHNWYPSERVGRYGFNGELAPIEIWDMFIDKRIPARYMKKGMASPVLFSKN